MGKGAPGVGGGQCSGGSTPSRRTRFSDAIFRLELTGICAQSTSDRAAPADFSVPVRTIIAGTLWKNATQMPAMIARLAAGAEQQPLVAEIANQVLEDAVGLQRRELEMEVPVALHQEVGVPLRLPTRVG